MDVCTSRKVNDRYYFNIAVRHRVPSEWEDNTAVIAKVNSALLVYFTHKWESFSAHSKEKKYTNDQEIRSFVSRWFNIRVAFRLVEKGLDLSTYLKMGNSPDDEFLCTFCNFFARSKQVPVVLGSFGITLATSSHIEMEGMYPMLSVTEHTRKYAPNNRLQFVDFKSSCVYAAVLTFHKAIVQYSGDQMLPVEAVGLVYNGQLLCTLGIAYLNGEDVTPPNQTWSKQLFEWYVERDREYRSRQLVEPSQLKKIVQDKHAFKCREYTSFFTTKRLSEIDDLYDLPEIE
jgi:hypothetical protein